MLRSKALLVLAAATVVSSSAWATPIVDGNVYTGEYAISILDTLGPETGFDSNHLNIDRMWFDSDGNASGFGYFGLTVTEPGISHNGGSTSKTHRTNLELDFYDTLGGTLLYTFDISVRGSTTTIALYDANADFVEIPLSPGDYTLVVGDALEGKIHLSLMPNFTIVAGNPGFFAMLSDTGNANDDQIQGTIPEPASVALLVAAAPFVLIWKRSRRRSR